jgi:hypothetical protein
VAIRGGRLTITGRKGNVLAETELENVRARALKRDAGASTRIWLPEKTYIVEWLAGTAVEIAGWSTAGSLGGALRSLSGVPRRRAITRAFLSALAEGGGDAGKDDDDAAASPP